MDARKKLIESITPNEQRIFIKFCFLLQWSSGAIFDTLNKLMPKNRLGKSTVEGWCTRFRKGDIQVEPHQGGDRSDANLKLERIEAIRGQLDESRHWSLSALSSRLGIPKPTIYFILRNDLKMKKKMGKWIPHELTPDQMEFRVLSCENNLSRYKKDKKLLDRTISIDETWVSLYMRPNRDQACSWTYPNEQPMNELQQNIHFNKRMLIMCMDINGIAFWELLPEKTTVNAQTYVNFLNNYVPNWLKGKSFTRPCLLHDNARPHKAKIVQDFLKQKNIPLWYQPPYSPDISPLDYGCFGPLKRKLKGIKFTSWDEFEEALGRAIEGFNDSGSADAIACLPSRWQSVIDSEGSYL